MAKSSGQGKEPDDYDKGSRRPNPVDVHVGGRIRFRRMLLAMSQEKLAEKLVLSFQQVQKYEKGVNRISASRLFDIARSLGVGVQFFFEEAPGTAPQLSVDHDLAVTPTQTSIVEFLRSRDGLALNRAFARMSNARARRAIVELVSRLANRDISGKHQPPALTRIAG